MNVAATDSTSTQRPQRRPEDMTTAEILARITDLLGQLGAVRRVER